MTTAAQIEAAGYGVWLLEVELGGVRYGWSSESDDLDIDDADRLYRPGLEEIVAMVDGSTPTEIAVKVMSDVDWQRLINGGLNLYGPARVLRWFSGTSRDQARVVLDGLLLAPAWGEPDEGLEATVARPPWLTATSVPEPSRAVTPDTWAPATGYRESGASSAKSYPVVIGAPTFTLPGGQRGGGSPGVLALLGTSSATLRSSKIIVADGHTVATEVRLEWSSDEQDEYDVVPLLKVTDDLGQEVTVVDLTDVEGVMPTSSGGYRVHWISGGGVPGVLDASTALSGAGEVIEYLLRRAGLPVDLGRLRSEFGRLNAFRLDCAITQPVSVEQWIQEHLGDTIGLFRRDTADGISYGLWPLRGFASRTTAGVLLVEDSGEETGGVLVRRVGPRTQSSVAEIANRITIEYAPDDGRPTRRVVIAGDATDGAKVARVCQWSQSRYGVRQLRMELATVQDDATAELIALRVAAARALPRTTWTVEGDVLLEALVQLGDVVAYTSAAAGWTERLVVVRNLQLEVDRVTLQLELLDDPTTVRDRARTGT